MAPAEATAKNAPRRDSYDAVVIGSGLGGLSAAAFLAKAGKSVLVVERLDGPGGYVHSFQRGSYVFDPAVHAVGQGRETYMLDIWLRTLGVRDRVDLIELDPFYTVIFPDFQLTVPFGVEEFIDAHLVEFPREEDGLREFLDVSHKIKVELDRLFAAPSLKELGDASAHFPTVLTYRNATLKEVLDEYLDDPRVKDVVSALWGYMGVPPSGAAFISFAGMLTSILEGGQFYCRGSFQSLVDAFVSGVVENGGELILGAHVDKIVVQDGRATGVVFDGSQVRASVVISNADATQTFERLVGVEYLPDRFVRRLRTMRTAISAFTVYAATKMDVHELGFAHEVFMATSWDFDRVWENVLRGEPSMLGIASPTLADPSLAPSGEQLLVILALMPYDIGTHWSGEKERYTERLLDTVEPVIPGLRESLTFVEGATPLALENYSLNKNGAMYGWENSPDQTLTKRLSNMTPIDRLYLAGAWAQPGSGTVGVMQSGFQTAQMILGYSDQTEFLDALGYTGPPSERLAAL